MFRNRNISCLHCFGFLSKNVVPTTRLEQTWTAAAYWISSSCLELPDHCPNSPLESNPLLGDCFHSNRTSEWRKNTFENPAWIWCSGEPIPSPVWIKRWSFLQIVFSPILGETEAFFLKKNYSMLILKPYPKWIRSLFLPLYPSKEVIKERDLIKVSLEERHSSAAEHLHCSQVTGSIPSISQWILLKSWEHLVRRASLR